jgi:alpha-tubulin suppressor-like RCC1 family protein
MKKKFLILILILFLIIKYSVLWEKFSLGAFHSLILNSKGEVYSVGDNYHGTLGVGKETENTNEIKKIENLKNIKIISAGDSHCFAFSNDKKLFLWGLVYVENSQNTKLFYPKIINSDNFLKDKEIEHIESNIGYSIISFENKIYLFGYFNYYEDGYNILNSQQIISKEKKIKKISAGCNFVLVLNEDNTLISFGYNNFGQLGVNYDLNFTLNPVPVFINDIPSDQKIIDISSGFF